jgi:acetylornithine/succinyldiaminopimelate/putrescine aminotransferase
LTRLSPTPTAAPEAIEALQKGFSANLSQTVPGRKELVVAEASGCTIKMADGRLFLDMISGIAVSNVGHSHPRVVTAVQQQMEKFAHVNVYGRFVIPAQVEIAQRLARVAPGDLQVAFLTNSGTEANEGALKLARKYTGRPGFITFERSFHGRTFGSLSVSWKDEYRKPFEPLLEGVRFIPYNDLDRADAAIDESVAAVIVEPIQGEAGVRIPSKEFLPGLRRLCDERGALLIVDEVQGAMGRAGHWFSFQEWEVVPDIVTLAKAFGGGLPLGAILSTPQIFDTFLDPPLSHLTTFGGNPVACAAAVASFDVIESEDLIMRARDTGGYLRRRLESVRDQFPKQLKDIRGLGLWFAIDVEPEEQTQALVELMEQRGVIVGSLLNAGGTVRIAPPLVVEHEEIDMLIGALRGALADLGGAA